MAKPFFQTIPGHKDERLLEFDPCLSCIGRVFLRKFLRWSWLLVLTLVPVQLSSYHCQHFWRIDTPIVQNITNLSAFSSALRFMPSSDHRSHAKQDDTFSDTFFDSDWLEQLLGAEKSYIMAKALHIHTYVHMYIGFTQYFR